MAFDIESLNLDDMPLEGLEEAFDAWSPALEFPPAIRPGKHSAIISDLRDASVKNNVLNVSVDLECKGNGEDGEKVTFVRLSGKMFPRFRDGVVSSQILDLIKSSGIDQKPKSNKDLLAIIKYLQDGNKFVSFKSDLRTYCTVCANKVLFAATSVEPEGTSVEEVKAAQTMAYNILSAMPAEEAKRINKEIRKAGTKHSSAKAIPLGASGRHLDIVKCPGCEADLRVQVNIVNWLVGQNVPTDATPF